MEGASPAGKGMTSSDDLAEGRMSLVLDDPGAALVDDDRRVVDPPRDTGVRGGEFRVLSWDPKERSVRCVFVLETTCIEARIPKSISSRLALWFFRTCRVHMPRKQKSRICMIPEIPHTPNHVAIKVMGATPKTSLRKSFRLMVIYTNVTPERAMLMNAAVAPTL